MRVHYGYAVLIPSGRIGRAVEAPHLVIHPMRLVYCIYPSKRDAEAVQRANPGWVIQRVKIMERVS